MKTFVTLYNFTDQGLQTIKDTVKRAEAAKAAAAKSGVKIKEILWLQGQFDLVVIAETPDNATANAFSISMLKAGNLRGQTLRAFTATEMAEIVEKVV
ncbi:GYD domain-containing protein [Rhodoblastus sp.]|uniref:GYD domain-containing protein n=1 Tax=Rhodoblastus sp. TaxID=1962975 RepID=UPI002619CF61|nr:GYD domain-containing protein [Rhodoblastus sp.]